MSSWLKEQAHRRTKSPAYRHQPLPPLLCLPGKLEWILASNGLDGDEDVDISKFDLSVSGRGLPERICDLLYDPTNGIVSGGDILVPGGSKLLGMIRSGEPVQDQACCD